MVVNNEKKRLGFETAKANRLYAVIKTIQSSFVNSLRF